MSKNSIHDHKTPLVYILAPSFSGSTLLTLVLANHPEIATIGELKASAMGPVQDYACSCGTSFLQCPFWKHVGEELSRRCAAFSLRDFRTHFRMLDRPLTDRVLRARVRGPLFEAVRLAAIRILPGAQRSFNEILERNLQLMEVLAKMRGARCFLDGSKDAIRLKYFLDAGLSTKVIYLLRDGRGTTNSYMRHYDAPMEQAVVEWRRTHEECSRVFERVLPEDRIRLRYEDLCRDPNEQLNQIYRMLGLDTRRAGTDLRIDSLHILGNSMRLAGTKQIRVDEKWRTMLSKDHLEVFDRIGGNLNRSYGYN